MHALSEIAVFKDFRPLFDGMQREKREGAHRNCLRSRLGAPSVKLINLSKGNVGMRQEICTVSGHILKCCSL